MKAMGILIEKKKKIEKPNNEKQKTKQKCQFPTSPILNIFSGKFQGLVFG